MDQRNLETRMTFPHAAVVGLGFMGRTHIQSLRRLGVEVEGILGVDQAEGERVGQEFGISRIYPSFHAVLSDPKVKVIHLCTPNNLHYPMAKAALVSGKNVICEKPLALNNDESSELARLAEDQKLVGVVDYNLRYYPLVQEARARLRSGEIGEPRLIHGGYLQDWLFLPDDWNWRLEPGQGGELRVVADIGTHWLDMVTWLTGLEVRAVMADLETFLPLRRKPRHEVETFAGKLENPIDTEEVAIHSEDTACILLAFSNGARGTLVLSQISAGRKNYLWWEIDGSKSSLRWDQENPNQLWVGQRDQPNQMVIKDPALMHPEARPFAGFPGGHAEGYPDTFLQLFRQVYTTVRDGVTPAGDLPSFADGHREMILCRAIQKSAKEKCWIELGSMDGQPTG
jgi:predicted dehydrogenase